MIEQRQLELDDYLDILRRRWWVILIPAIVSCAGAFLISFALPSQYTSQTLVLVEQQKVPENYVKSVVPGDIEQQLGTMREQILSRTRLQPIIDKFDLYKNDRGKVPIEDLVERMRKDIVITPVLSVVTTKAGELPGFTITFTASDPHVAQQVCAEITSMFIEENLHLLEQSAVGTSDFLKDQLDEAKRQLDSQDAKLADFKRKYMGSLPSDEQTDAQLLGSLTSQLDAVTGQLSRAQQDKSYEESMLNQQLTALKSSQQVDGKEDETLQKELTDDKAQLAAMQGHYTSDYPDVIKLKSDIAALEKKIANKEPATKTPANSTPAGAASSPGDVQETAEIKQLRLQIHFNDVMIQQKTKEQDRLKQQVGSIQGRLSMSPAVEEQYKEVTRDHDTALKFYNELLVKKSDSEMATNLERAQKGTHFSIMDPADLPEKPSFPNRPAFAGGGLGIGLMLGVGWVMLLELRDKSMRSEADIERALGLPVLASVPVIGEGKHASKGQKPKRKKNQTLLGDIAQA